MLSSLNTGFETLTKDLQTDEVQALQKFSGRTTLLLISFFQEIINCNVLQVPFHSSEKWGLLTKDEKLILSARILQWYKTLLLFDPNYGKRCHYTTMDDEKLKIVIHGKDLANEDDFKEYILSLRRMKAKKIDEEASVEMINWLDRKIEDATERKGEEQYDDAFIFPGEIIDIMTAYYIKFNGVIFEKTGLEEFLNLFRLNRECRIVFKENLKGHFKYSISKIETHHKFEGDFNNWFSKKLKGAYKNSKGVPKKNSDITQEIDSFFKSMPNM
jgi:hypothetical protein